MVWGDARFFYLMQATKLLDQRTFKTATLVGGNAARYTKLKEPFVKQDLGHGGSTLVPGWDSHSVFAKYSTSVIMRTFSKPLRVGFKMVKSVAMIWFD